MPTTDEIRLSPKCFKKMENLKIFINVNGRFIGKVKHYPNQLRLLDWPQCPLEYLPSNFDMKKMVQLNMGGSRITRLKGGFKSMQNLTSLNLCGCHFLTQIPDMSGSPNLEFLDLSWCSSLEMVHPSVGNLKKLVTLNLYNCCNLVKLPPEVNCRSLQQLDLGDCRKLESFPEIVGEMKCMKSLSLRYTGIKTLPSSIRYLINLEKLSLNLCRDLTDLPRSIYELQNLEDFDLAECPKLVTFPTKVDLPDGGDYLPGCNSSKIDFLGSTLVYLNLSGCPFVTLPECIKEFFNLSRLILRGCTRLVEIPELPALITELDASDCVSLERISKLSNILERKESQMIERMYLTNCWRLCQNLLAEMAASKEDDDLFSRLLCSQLSDFEIIFPVPRSKIPKWFSCQMDFMGHQRFEFWIEALPNFKWDNNTGLAFCVALDGPYHCRFVDSFHLWIYINEVRVLYSDVNYSSRGYYGTRESNHVSVGYISFAELWRCGYMRPLPPFNCRVVLHPLPDRFSDHFKFKSCGVHLIMPPNEDVCMKLIRAENLTSERSDDDDDDEVDSSKGNWERYRPKHRKDCKELYTDALQQNQEQ
ncbi:PREDICTED: protein SUPPRESSOR OF npr1-1, CONSTITUTIVE 1-like [Fragaria vesca subsp. vesca]